MVKPRVAAIIQARMGSTRLPGKVLMPLAGKPVLWHLIYRLRKCRTVTDIAIATSTNVGDDPIEKFAREEGIICVRGSEENVLERYLLAIKQLNPEVVIRICGDAPLVDPAVMDDLVEALVAQEADYSFCEAGVPNINLGIDPCSRAALEQIGREAGDDPVAMEHVTAYFFVHPENFRAAVIPVPEAHRFNNARTALDTPADHLFLERVYAELGVPAGDADLEEVVRLLRRKPELCNINSHVRQKTATETSRRLLIRCDGDQRLGLGHVMRCLTLGRELRDSHSWGVMFAMATGQAGVQRVEAELFPVQQLPEGMTEEAWLDGLLAAWQPDALLLDVRNDLGPEALLRWRSQGIVVACLDDSSLRRLAADLNFYPPVPQLQQLDWSGFSGKVYSGWQWIVLNPVYLRQPPRPYNPVPRLLVTMGGSDPAGLTLRAIAALEQLPLTLTVTLVLGPAFAHDAELAQVLQGTHREYDVYRNLADLTGVAAAADVALASFGGTAYELAAMGLPTLLLGLTADHAASAEALAAKGLARNLGAAADLTDAALATALVEALEQPDWMAQVPARAAALFRASGAAAVARELADTVARRHL